MFGEERLRDRKKADPFTFNLMRTSLAWMASFSVLPPPCNRCELQQGGCERKDTFPREVTLKTSGILLANIGGTTTFLSTLKVFLTCVI